MLPNSQNTACIALVAAQKYIPDCLFGFQFQPDMSEYLHSPLQHSFLALIVKFVSYGAWYVFTLPLALLVPLPRTEPHVLVAPVPVLSVQCF